jgi:translation initiation factor IF-2
LGQFKELNIFLKGDVDGSVEALSDSFSKLSTEVQNIIHKGVGAITETDVMLASASDVLSDLMFVLLEMRQLADKEEIDIRYYLSMQQSMTERCNGRNVIPEKKKEVLGRQRI